jgi:hypothetical protein
MADELRMAFAELLHKAQLDQDADFLLDSVRMPAHELMDAELTQHIGAERYQRSPERTGQRNGYWERQWDTRVGTIDLQVPRVRDGTFFPARLEPRKRAEKALASRCPGSELGGHGGLFRVRRDQCNRQAGVDDGGQTQSAVWLPISSRASLTSRTASAGLRPLDRAISRSSAANRASAGAADTARASAPRLACRSTRAKVPGRIPSPRASSSKRS